MKIALISDLHIKLHKKNNKFLPHIIKSLDHFYEQCEQRNIEKVFILGDVFHVKDIIGVETQHHAIIALHKIMKRFDTYLIPGNHDILSKNSTEINSVSIFKHSCNFVDDLKCFTLNKRDYYFLPFFTDELIKEKLSTIKINRESYLITHLGLRGFNLDNGHEDIFSELKSEDIDKGFKRVFSGHYHHRSNDGHIYYLGNPYELTWQDYNDTRGFHLFDLETRNLEFIANPYTMFERLEYNDKDTEPVNLDELDLAQKYVKLVVVNKTDFYKFDKFIQKLYNKGCHEIKIIEDMSEFSDGEIGEEINLEDTLSVLAHYIDSIETDVDKEQVKTYMRTLYTEAVNIEV